MVSVPDSASTKPDGQNRDARKGERSKNNLWKWKIRSTFPLIFIKPFQKNSDKETETEKQRESKTSAGTKNPLDERQTSSGMKSKSQKLAEKKTLLNSEEEERTHFDLAEQPGTEADKLENPSALQSLANAFRKTFNAPVVMRAKREGKPRPMSVGDFSADPWGAGQNLPSLLQDVQEKDSDGSRVSRRRVNLFSSLRLRKKEQREVEGRDQEVRDLLANFRNKGSSQQKLEDISSSEDENENSKSNRKVCCEKRKTEQLKRLRRAQAVQRQLEEVGEKQRDIEEKGVAIEKTIRGETDGDEARLYQAWFKLVLEKNRLSRYESELMIFARELELEDTQSRLQQDLRRRLAVEDTNKSASELQEEQELLSEIMRTVEMRDALVSVLEEQRLKERAEDEDLESLILSKGYEFHWRPENQ